MCFVFPGLCVEEKCVITDNTVEDPISSPTTFLKDWEVQGPVEIRALSSPRAEMVLFRGLD